VITRSVDNQQFAVYTHASGVVIEKVAAHSFTGDSSVNRAVNVQEGSAAVQDCDLRGAVVVREGAELLLQKCTVRDCATAAAFVQGTAVVQDYIIQNGEHNGIEVRLTGELTVTGTTIRRCLNGLFVNGKATIGKGCSITASVKSGVFAWKSEGGLGAVTVEGDADLVCSGNNTSDHEWHGDCVSVQGRGWQAAGRGAAAAGRHDHGRRRGEDHAPSVNRISALQPAHPEPAVAPLLRRVLVVPVDVVAVRPEEQRLHGIRRQRHRVQAVRSRFHLRQLLAVVLGVGDEAPGRALPAP